MSLPLLAAAALAPWARLPRTFSVLRVGDVDGDGDDDVVALDPRTRALRGIVSEQGAAPDVEPLGRWPKAYTFTLARVDDDEAVDAVGVDRRTGRVRIAYGDGGAFRVDPEHRAWRIPPHASLTVADVTGDTLGDLVFRSRGSDEVWVRRLFVTPGPRDIHAVKIEYRFQPARRWGRWDRRLALMVTTLDGVDAGLAARDPRSGRIVFAAPD